MDELGRPVVWHDGRETLRRAEMDGEKAERIRRVETYLKSSNLSLVCNSGRQIRLFLIQLPIVNTNLNERPVCCVKEGCVNC